MDDEQGPWVIEDNTHCRCAKPVGPVHAAIFRCSICHEICCSTKCLVEHEKEMDEI